jgi:hypothetical protein
MGGAMHALRTERVTLAIDESAWTGRLIVTIAP